MSKIKTLLKFRVTIKKNHRILKFNIRIFKTIFERNTDLQKIKNNSIFGKPIENPKNKVDVIIVTTRKQNVKWSFRPIFKVEKQFRNEAIAIEKEKCRINLNKTIYIKRSILDLSKVLMQDFQYNFNKNKYGHKAS